MTKCHHLFSDIFSYQSAKHIFITKQDWTEDRLQCFHSGTVSQTTAALQCSVQQRWMVMGTMTVRFLELYRGGIMFVLVRWEACSYA